MNAFRIQWSPAQLSELNAAKYAHFFIIEAGGTIYYIGNAYQQRLSEVIPACLRDFKLDHLKLRIYLGRIREFGTGRVTAEDVSSLHQLLVFANKPRLNRVERLRYEGLPNLTTRNSGCALLPMRVRAENRKVFRSSQRAAG